MIQAAAIMIEPSLIAEPEPATDGPTIWGLTPMQIHDRFWACSGIQVVRQGEKSEIVGGAKLFLLASPRLMLMFHPPRLPHGDDALLCLRLHDQRDKGYFERMESDADGRLIGFKRQYHGGNALLARAFLTRDRELAISWQQCESPRQAWRKLKSATPRKSRRARSIVAEVFDASDTSQVVEFMHRLAFLWHHPDATIHRPRRHVSTERNVWADREAIVSSSIRFIGPAWIGAGRKLESESVVIGPAILWDDPTQRPRIESLRWEAIQPASHMSRPIRPRRRPSLSRAGKRAFDFVFALLAIAITLPLYPLVMLAIYLEDGRPFFFVHRRETRFGREFPCLKFRSMKKFADDSQGHLTQVNQADGPHFYVEYDPRLTRIGRLLRKTNLDELPQFFNVLLGQMSLVGPRPSPYEENQFCPAWREARLSVRPGITGLWQVARTRKRGLDFQEWIKYDIEYVENAGWRLDLKILWRTAWKVVRMEG
jgi:lipopolysaccharide/colanic/teichoic acid biosynthesis glycosyltransferase